MLGRCLHCAKSPLAHAREASARARLSLCLRHATRILLPAWGRGRRGRGGGGGVPMRELSALLSARARDGRGRSALPERGGGPLLHLQPASAGLTRPCCATTTAESRGAGSPSHSAWPVAAAPLPPHVNHRAAGFEPPQLHLSLRGWQARPWLGSPAGRCRRSRPAHA